MAVAGFRRLKGIKNHLVKKNFGAIEFYKEQMDKKQIHCMYFVCKLQACTTLHRWISIIKFCFRMHGRWSGKEQSSRPNDWCFAKSFEERPAVGWRYRALEKKTRMEQTLSEFQRRLSPLPPIGEWNLFSVRRWPFPKSNVNYEQNKGKEMFT